MYFITSLFSGILMTICRTDGTAMVSTRLGNGAFVVPRLTFDQRLYGGNGINSQPFQYPDGCYNSILRIIPPLSGIWEAITGSSMQTQQWKGKNLPARIFQLGELCDCNAQCQQSITNSLCQEYHCSCKHGFSGVLGGQICSRLEFGSPCYSNDECFSAGLENSACRNRVCDCAPGYYKDASKTCSRVTLGMKCPFEGRCSDFIPGTTCNEAIGTCECDVEGGFQELDGQCYGCGADKVFFSETRKCYYLGTESVNWQTAYARCLAMGMDLTSIHRDEENLFVVALHQAFGTTEDFWLGLNDIIEEGTFRWTDGTPLNYRNWLASPPQPDNAGGVADCVNWLGAAQYQAWGDAPCSWEFNYICKGDPILP